jgi:hypothetical protein
MVVSCGFLISRFHGCSTLLHGLDNILITSASTQVAFKLFANHLLAGIGMAFAQVNRAQDHSGGAKTTLQTMAVFKGGLHGVHGPVGIGQTLDGCDLCALGLRQQDIA